MSRRGGDPYQRFARALTHHARRVAGENRHVETFKVVRSNPLLLESLHGDDVLEEGDDDFEIEQAVYDYDSRFGIDKDDLIRVTYDGSDWWATGVVADKSTNTP